MLWLSPVFGIITNDIQENLNLCTNLSCIMVILISCIIIASKNTKHCVWNNTYLGHFSNSIVYGLTRFNIFAPSLKGII